MNKEQKIKRQEFVDFLKSEESIVTKCNCKDGVILYLEDESEYIQLWGDREWSIKLDLTEIPDNVIFNTTYLSLPNVTNLNNVVFWACKTIDMPNLNSVSGDIVFICRCDDIKSKLDLTNHPNVKEYNPDRTYYISDFKGRTLTDITHSACSMTFTFEDGREYIMKQDDYMSDVEIEDICGDLKDLIGSPLLVAEEVTSSEHPKGVVFEHELIKRDGIEQDSRIRTESGSINTNESFTWTFYKLATRKGYVTLRWIGFSNGYYSEEVGIKEIIPYQFRQFRY